MIAFLEVMTREYPIPGLDVTGGNDPLQDGHLGHVAGMSGLASGALTAVDEVSATALRKRVAKSCGPVILVEHTVRLHDFVTMSSAVAR